MTIISTLFLKRKPYLKNYSYKHDKANYYRQHNYIVNNRVLGDIFNNAKKMKIQYKVSVPITPLNIKLGTYYYGVLEFLENPKFEIKRGIGEHHEVLFYRKRIGTYKFLSQLHFYRNQLVYVKSDFDYLACGNNTRNLLLNLLFKKYSIDADYKLEKDVVLADNDGNILVIMDNGKISLRYYISDKELVNEIFKLSKSKIYKQSNNQEENILLQKVV